MNPSPADFTVKIYRLLLRALMDGSYAFQTFDEFIQTPAERSVVLRHDVDLMPRNSLAFARIQHALGIRGVYYFRAVPESWDERIIREIAALGHEIGYHYECLTTCRGNLERAIEDFGKNLTALRQLAPVSTVCMHGSPMSPYDSKDLWKTYAYADFGIIAEPYFDVDFQKVAYFTDTGRRWDNGGVSVRDKVNASFVHNFRTTHDIIAALRQNSLPRQIMFNFHPQRWNDNLFLWTRELVLQRAKNEVKRYFFVKK